MQRALRELENIADVAGAPLVDITATLARATTETGEALRDLQSLANAADLDPVEAEQAEERLFALRAAARRHDVEVDDLADELTRLRASLSAIEHSEENSAKLSQGLEAAKRDYLAAAEALSKARRSAAKKLDKAVAAELGPLKLDQANFRTVVDRLPEAAWGARGLDDVHFEVATNPGSAHGTINKVASGGELARFMLAIKVVLARSSPNTTLIFDEVDAGIGGATAAAVGARLSRLADDRQVLVVTHSPQVAAIGKVHLKVSKMSGGAGGAKSAKTAIDEITDTDRREEIARMISGAEITDEARAAADELMKGAQVR